MTTFCGPPVETETDVGSLTFGGFLKELKDRYGQRDAIRYVAPDSRRVVWTYSELWEHARAVAKALVAAGINRGTRVGILMGSRPEWVASVWGATMAGGVAVPFNTFSEGPELGQLLRHSDVALVLCQAQLLRHRYLDLLLELCPRAHTAQPGHLYSGDFPFLRRIVVIDGPAGGAVESWDAFLRRGAGIPDTVIDGIMAETVPTEDGIIIYSSGTTSRPKGVLHTHRAPMLQSWRHGYRERFTPQDRIYCALPLFWTAGFAAVLGATLASGACLVITPYFEPSLALRVIEEDRITIPQGLPKTGSEMLEAQRKERRDISSLRRYVYQFTGEEPPGGIGRAANNASYGSSETFTSATALPFGSPLEETITYGRLVPGSQMRIINPDSGRSLGIGEEGEIILKGPTLMKGYLKVAPEHTLDEEGFFHTGDSGWFDEHELLHFTGRFNNMIKTSGANVSPLEVEEALVAHPDIDAAAVVGIPAPTAGETVVACVVPRSGASLTENSVRDSLRGRLSSYKIPRRVLFFPDQSELPRTASNKFSVNAVRDLVVELLDDPGQRDAGRDDREDR
jgi:acyl-CoA synthetase (AMP-forming)/AMP-acid ligase II